MLHLAAGISQKAENVENKGLYDILFLKGVKNERNIRIRDAKL